MLFGIFLFFHISEEKLQIAPLSIWNDLKIKLSWPSIEIETNFGVTEKFDSQFKRLSNFILKEQKKNFYFPERKIEKSYESDLKCYNENGNTVGEWWEHKRKEETKGEESKK